jgi:DNA-binding MarR family transcriptional regulator
MDYDPHQDAVTQLNLTVFRLNGALLDWGDRLVQPLGLTSARWQILGAMALANRPMTVPQIGEAMGVTRQGAQKQIHLLQQQQLVESMVNPAHRRSPLYSLTPQGLALYRQVDSLWADCALSLGQRIPAQEAIAATRTLASLLDLLPTTHPNARTEK